MNSKILVAVSSLLLILIVHSPAFAKGDTVKITLTNLESGAIIGSTDNSVKRFGVWRGPGSFINSVPQGEGFIISWSKGAVAAPSGLVPRYQVRFYEGCKFSDGPACHSEEPSLVYVVTYSYDPATKQGYVYLPDKGEEFYDRNVRSIYRGVEGKWFVASDECQSFVLPLIQNNSASRTRNEKTN